MTQTNTLQYIKPGECNHVEKPLPDQLTGKLRVTPFLTESQEAGA